MIGSLTRNTTLALVGVVALMTLATPSVFILDRLVPNHDFTEMKLRVRSWWVMLGVFSLAIMLNRTVSLVLFGFVSFLALKEYFSIIPTRRAHRRVLFCAYLAIPVQYYWVADAWYGMFIIFIPVFMFLLLAVQMVLAGQTEGLLKALSTLHWGLVTTVFLLSHCAYLMILPQQNHPNVDGAGLVLFLVFLTQFNDVCQFIWGKLLGRHRIVPIVSPNKTWEGFLGGVATTTLVAILIAPYLTPLTGWETFAAGAIISIGGFLGDVTISALKRDLGIKDTGTMLPGHGGILDRVDSLTFTSPLFFHFIYNLHY